MIPAPNFVPGLLESNLLVENFYNQGNMVFISMYCTSIYWHITYVSAQHSEIKRIIDKDFRILQLTRKIH